MIDSMSPSVREGSKWVFGVKMRIREFLKHKYEAKYSDGKKAECIKYKLWDLFDPIDN